jgi:hypothetical protein
MRNNPEKNPLQLLERLKHIPQDSRVLMMDVPFGWLIYINCAPNHKYYIAVNRLKHKEDLPSPGPLT